MAPDPSPADLANALASLRRQQRVDEVAAYTAAGGKLDPIVATALVGNRAQRRTLRAGKERREAKPNPTIIPKSKRRRRR